MRTPPKNNDEAKVEAIILSTIVGLSVGGIAAGPLAPGSPYMPIVGPVAGAPPAPWRDDEPTTIYRVPQNGRDVPAGTLKNIMRQIEG